MEKQSRTFRVNTEENELNKLSFEIILNLCLDEYEKENYVQMQKYADEAKKRNPYNLMANYLSAISNSSVGNCIDSYRDLCCLKHLQNTYKEYIVSEDELNELITQARKNVENDDLDEVNEKIRRIDEYYEMLGWGLFTSFKPIDGYFRKLSVDGELYYMAGYFGWGASSLNVTDQGSCLTNKTDIYQIDDISNEKNYDGKLPCIVPIVANYRRDKFINVLSVEEKSQNYRIVKSRYKQYDYCRIDEPTKITSRNEMVFGMPIPLKHDKSRKKLVLSIFLDSFNWKVVKEHSLEECMPYTYNFFKEGLICEECYAGSEFTYPSIASYWTGMRSSHHKMLNQSVKRGIPHDMKVFPEIFKEAGYFTAKIGGNDSVIPEFGYLRGIDRFLYQYWQENFFVHEAVHQTIEHMEAFKETDQYIWLDIPDLHDVAGMWDMPLSVQTSSPLYVNEVDFKGRYPGTLYHTPSPNRRVVYLKEMAYIDRQLEILYQYIRENYSKDEVVVTLFSDHGNAFNVDEGEPFMSWQRQNVPMLIYGPEFEENHCNELIESVDYGQILCHFAGLDDVSLKKNDGNLPAFCGGVEKEYVFAQSQHPDREYAAFIGTKTYRFYLESCRKVEKDCRIEMSAGSYMYLVDMEGNDFYDQEIMDKCKEIVLENIRDFAY